MKRLILLLSAALLCGCATSGPEFSYPAKYMDLFERARKDAVARIKSVDGKTPKLNTDVKGQVVPGQRKYGNTWCWFSKEWNFWVAGLCYLTDPIKPTVADNPKTGGEIHYESLVHESGHEVGWDAYGYANHPAKYARIFESWRDPPRSHILMGADGRLCAVDGFPVDAEHPAPEMGASDDASAKALLQQAIAFNQLAIRNTQDALAAMDGTTPPVTNAPSGSIDLAAFKWRLSGKDGRLAEPTGLPAGARYGEGVEGGKRCCQWHWGDFILHCWFASSVSSISGSSGSAKWYHFTRTKTPHPGLSQYGWYNSHQTPDAGGLWYRWVRTK